MLQSQSQPHMRPVCGFQRSNSRWHDSDSDSSVISERGCRPLTACKVAPAVATLTNSSRSSSIVNGVLSMDSCMETPAHYSTNTSNACSLTSSPVFCLKRQESNGIQFVCPKPKRSSTDSTKTKRWSNCTPPPKECTLNWSDSDEDEYESEADVQHRDSFDEDSDDGEDADSVLYRRLMCRHPSISKGPTIFEEEHVDDDDEPVMFAQDL